MSPELGLIIAPRTTYAALVRLPAHASFLLALRRPLLVAIVLGVSVAISATHAVNPLLVASTTIAWSYVVALQMAIALPLVAGPSRRTVGLPRALDLFFAGHAPWSLFALLVAAWGLATSTESIWPIVAAALLPCALTARIVHAFFREVLALDAAAALRRTVTQQALTWAIVVAINWAASAFTPRLIELGRQL
ncbi:MAG TPA: hypothetical protein VGI12_19620 [Vicinamibacterales bacterium]